MICLVHFAYSSSYIVPEGISVLYIILYNNLFHKNNILCFSMLPLLQSILEQWRKEQIKVYPKEPSKRDKETISKIHLTSKNLWALIFFKFYLHVEKKTKLCIF